MKVFPWSGITIQFDFFPLGKSLESIVSSHTLILESHLTRIDTNSILELIKVYTALVRPMVDYSWHAGLTKGQEDMVQSVQE